MVKAIVKRKGRGFTCIVVMTTVVTLLLQITLLYKNQCYLTDARTDTSRSLIQAVVQRTTPRRQVDSSIQFQNNTNVNQKPNTFDMTPHPGQKRTLTIGIPTVRRPNENYFETMLQSMFNKTSFEQMKQIVFVVFLADIDQKEWKAEMEASIKAKYSEHITSGSLIVTQAPTEFYKSMATYGNNSYMNWRTKQNFDYSFLMKYSSHLSKYYMQMEDDVIASDGYYSAIMNFVNRQEDDSWVCLEFSTLGFIGKLYHSSDIINLSELILMFNYSQPVDYLFVYYNMVSKRRTAMRKPTLFQHLGFHSSLDKKIQPLKDKFFDFPPKVLNGDNPNATLQTTLRFPEDFPPNLAYSNTNGFFWSNEPAKSGSNFTIIFHTPQSLDKIQILSGLDSHKNDKIHHAELLATPSFTERNAKLDCKDFIKIGEFTDGNIHLNRTVITSKLGMVKAKCLQINFTADQFEWVIIKEIAVFVA